MYVIKEITKNYKNTQKIFLYQKCISICVKSFVNIMIDMFDNIWKIEIVNLLRIIDNK